MFVVSMPNVAHSDRDILPFNGLGRRGGRCVAPSVDAGGRSCSIRRITAGGNIPPPFGRPNHGSPEGGEHVARLPYLLRQKEPHLMHPDTDLTTTTRAFTVILAGPNHLVGERCQVEACFGTA